VFDGPNRVRCRFCHERRGLIEAHIIPEGFWRPFRDGDEVPRLLSSDEYPKRIPTGVYDRTILCTSCEQRFGPWDQYAQQVLQDELRNARAQRVGPVVVGYEVDQWDYDRLKLFFISLFWRAAVSTQPFFRRISPGRFADRARLMLTTGDPGSPDDFAVVLAKSATRYGRAIMDPFVGPIDDITYATFFLGFYVAYIKLDKRPSIAPLRTLQLAPGRPLKVIARNFGEGRELPVLQRLLEKPQNRRRPRGRGRGHGAG